MTNSQECNVYVWFDKRVPFYVGIGGESRLRSKRRNKWATNRRKECEIRGDFLQEIVFSGLRTSCENIEKHLILSWKSVKEDGLLFNFTKGGEGGETFSQLPPEKQENVRNGARRVAEVYAHQNGTLVGHRHYSEKTGLFDPRYTENLLEWCKAGSKAQSLEDKATGGKRGSKVQHAQKWMCTVTGHVSTPCGLSSYQKARGINTKNRERLQ
jgi:hypothetical protein